MSVGLEISTEWTECCADLNNNTLSAEATEPVMEIVTLGILIKFFW